MGSFERFDKKGNTAESLIVSGSPGRD